MQSDVIFGFIAAAFIFYITAKGELGTYIDILRGGGQQPGHANSNSGSSNLAQTVNSAASDLSSAEQGFNSASDILDNAAASNILSNALGN